MSLPLDASDLQCLFFFPLTFKASNLQYSLSLWPYEALSLQYSPLHHSRGRRLATFSFYNPWNRYHVRWGNRRSCCKSAFILFLNDFYVQHILFKHFQAFAFSSPIDSASVGKTIICPCGSRISHFRCWRKTVSTFVSSYSLTLGMPAADGMTARIWFLCSRPFNLSSLLQTASRNAGYIFLWLISSLCWPRRQLRGRKE